MPPPALSFEEACRILRALHELVDEPRIVVVGGQAVAFWYRELSRRGYLSGERLGPLTSKDIDFRGARRSVERAAALLDGEARLPTMDDHTPSTGIVLFSDSEGHRRQIDFVDAPYGLNSRDVSETAQRVELPEGKGTTTSALLIHPERLMESRVHNVIGLRQDRAQAIEQLSAAIECAGAFSRLILDAHDPGPVIRRRAVLKLNERIYRFSRRPRARRLFRERGIDTFAAVVADHPALPRKFREVRYPQMRARLAELPERRNRGWIA